MKPENKSFRLFLWISEPVSGSILPEGAGFSKLFGERKRLIQGVSV